MLLIVDGWNYSKDTLRSMAISNETTATDVRNTTFPANNSTNSSSGQLESGRTSNHTNNFTLHDSVIHANNRTLQLEKEYQQKHAHHENAHFAMIMILVFSLIIAQVVVLEWRKRHYKSFSLASTIGLAFVPLLISIGAGFTRFIVIWTIFAILNSWVLYRATRRPISSKTPRLVYKWYSVMYKLCYAVGVFGYTMMVFTFLGVSQIFFEGGAIFQFSILSLFYGLYFGVLGRDLVEIISDRMASNVGYYTPEGIPQKHLRDNVCAICGNTVNMSKIHTPAANPNLRNYSNANRFQSGVIMAESLEYDGIGDDGEEEGEERVHRLACRHVFHEQCIRGWAIIGKKDMCPYCKEKVDMKIFTLNPWDKTELLYLQLIDGLRYLVVWQPLIFGLVQGIYKLFGLE
ncbi:hypothetical protein BKA69DRAFT_1062954, partial [Paraphysoderma sedebokerense]